MDSKKAYVIIPVRMLSNVKSRLSTLLSPEFRREFNVRMIIDVIEATLKADGVEDVVIVSPDPKVSKILTGYDVHFLQERTEAGVNVAAESAINYCLSDDVSRVLVLPSDIPLITSEDLDAIIRMGEEPSSVVISPSARFDGTNALLLNPPKIIPLSYDQNSFHNHFQSAFKAEAKVKIYLSRRVMLDIDWPEDTGEFMKTGDVSKYSFRFLNKRLTLKLPVRRYSRRF